MDEVAKYIVLAGKILTAGTKLVSDVEKIVEITGKVINNGTASDDDWNALHAYEDAETAILNEKMEGEK